MASHDTARTLELKIPPLAVVLITALLMWVAARMLPSLDVPFLGRSLSALIVAAGGIAVAAAGVAAFRRAMTTVNPMKPDDASTLVMTGIYRHTRNPMYLGFLCLLFAWAIFLSNAASFGLIPVFVAYLNRFQILPEERALNARFGEQFAAYRAKVPRWL